MEDSKRIAPLKSAVLFLLLAAVAALVVLQVSHAGSSVGQAAENAVNSLSPDFVKPSRIIIADDSSYAPYMFLDTEGKPAGITVEFWKLWSSKTGIAVEFRLMQWDAALSAVQNGEADALGGLARTEKRQKNFAFVGPLYTIATSIFFHEQILGIRGLEDLQGFPVGVVKGHNSVDLILQRYPKAMLLEYPGTESLVKAAVLGEIKVFVADSEVANYYLAKYDQNSLFHETTRPIVSDPQYAAVKIGNSPLLAVLQDGFNQISEKEIHNIVASWTGKSRIPRIPRSTMQLIGGAVAALLALIFLWNVNLRKTVAKVLREVERRNLELQDSEARFKAFFDLAPYGFAVNDLQRRYRMVNQAFCRRIGMREEEVVGHTGAELGIITDEATFERMREELLRTGELTNREVIFSSSQGLRYALYSSRLIESGGEQLVLSATVDITERKRAEEALRESENSFTRLFESAPIPMAFASEIDGYRATTWNDSWYRTFGYAREEADGRSGADIGLWVDQADRQRFLDKVEMQNYVSGLEVRMRRCDGAIRYCELFGRFIGKTGQQVLMAAYIDITVRKEAEKALQESEELFSKAFRVSPAAMVISDIETGRFIDVNEQWLRMLGHSREETIGQTSYELGIWENPEVRIRLGRQLQATGSLHNESIRFITQSGDIRDVLWSAEVANLGGSEVMLSLFYDFTNRKKAEDALRESESYNKVLFHDSHIPLAVLDPETFRFTDCNQAAVKIYGFTDRSELLGKTTKDVSAPLQYDGQPSDEARAEKIRLTLAQGSAVFEWKHQKPNGAIWDSELHLMSFSHRDRKLIQLSLSDITGRKRAETALKESEERFSKAFSSSPAPLVISDIETGRFIDFNENWLRMTGYSREDLIGSTSYDLGVWRDPQDRKQLALRLRQDGHIKDFPSQIVTVSGKIRDVIWAAEIINIGGAEVMLSLVYDYTDKKRAEEEKEKLQMQLLQSQKLESVGRLAGGVAHDYNNMLGVILGHAELAMLKTDESHPLHVHLREIRLAAQRSAELTQQLLAFARRQTIAPKVIDLNRSVTTTLQMLHLIIGENIELVWLPGDEAFPVKIDPSQFDQLLMNLCVNARDAIDGVGRISIETGRIILDEAYCATNTFFTPGDYVVLAVSDTGCGMDKETRAKIFEPFFTTKDLGKGTGLGLATVYGIVKQNDGFINVYSEPGQGTTFRIYLPRYAGLSIDDGEVEVDSISRNNNETVLVVEDEAVLLDINTTMLLDLGYKVLAAGSPVEAIRLAGEHAGRIDLLMTDVVMPEMNGRQLEGQVQKTNPGIKVLFMSGYTANVISHHGVLDEGVHFIQKPFTLKDVAMKVRSTLDQKPEDERREGDRITAGESLNT